MTSEAQAGAVIEQLCRLPRDFHELKTMSAVDLIKRSGYLDLREALTRERIEHRLRENPALVNDWLNWSDNQRIPEGWAFQENANGRYAVFHFPDGDEFVFTDRSKACAEFIVRQVEAIAQFAYR